MRVERKHIFHKAYMMGDEKFGGLWIKTEICDASNRVANKDTQT